MEKIYDVIIIGGGPAGLSAGLYAGRSKMDALIIEKAKKGGQIVSTDEVVNVPCSIRETTGPAIIERLVEQVESFGTTIIKDSIKEAILDGDIKVLKGLNHEYKAKSVIIANGAKPRLLGVPGEGKLTGKGVSYCATCDGDFFTDLEVFVVGGGDSAVEEAMFLTRFAKKVTILCREGALTCAKSIAEKVNCHQAVEIIYNTEIVEIIGDGIVESMIVRNNITGEEQVIIANEEDGTFGIFVFIGFIPQTEIYKDRVYMEHGYIVTNQDMHTDVDGVFAAGDCRVKSLRQVVTAISDGAIAAVQAEKYLESKQCDGSVNVI
ncbi:FAD-dependent oxidoreductase [Alkaliphilus peptidifermentans]|uniref:Thioredoxin reductase (NADPH) n=1 Tax=Alkaliphilus peptidifermentans DSM 18978 TaxID=1120976 RepID=A0A1G5L3B1_9FIRM|nr:FAD-dependent oxidoreductase [Alkaliphilus peptidifermentans]SCZ06669.1 thioredoxin reductase (NADPH) [Alkaliphilus peptidifermentans DSM 18978]